MRDWHFLRTLSHCWLPPHVKKNSLSVSKLDSFKKKYHDFINIGVIFNLPGLIFLLYCAIYSFWGFFFSNFFFFLFFFYPVICACTSVGCRRKFNEKKTYCISGWLIVFTLWFWLSTHLILSHSIIKMTQKILLKQIIDYSCNKWKIHSIARNLFQKIRWMRMNGICLKWYRSCKKVMKGQKNILVDAWESLQFWSLSAIHI